MLCEIIRLVSKITKNNYKNNTFVLIASGRRIWKASGCREAIIFAAVFIDCADQALINYKWLIFYIEMR